MSNRTELNATSLNGRRFVGVENVPNGEVSRETVFHYHEENGTVWGEYSGGPIVRGTLLGRRVSVDKIEFVYQQLNSHGCVMTGRSLTTIETLFDGRLRMIENWQWTSGDHSTGTSVVEELLTAPPNKNSASVQLGWVVTDIEEAIARFTRLFGLKEWRIESWPEETVAGLQSLHRGADASGWKARMAFSSIQGVEIEFIQNIAGASTYSEWLQEHGEGLHHVMFRVADMQLALADFERIGIVVTTCSGIRSSGGLSLIWAAFDTASRIGINIEIKKSDPKAVTVSKKQRAGG